MSVPLDTAVRATGTTLERYYRWHAPVYDLTRWAFLFGRSALLRRLGAGPAPRHVLEVGCGTGRNLATLARRFPNARLTGVDLSDAMLARAEPRLHVFGSRVRCLRSQFEAPLSLDPPCDVVLVSYALSMMNPGYAQALRAAAAQLPLKGRIAVVDFAASPWPWFRRWMARNHVRLDDHLLPMLQTSFDPEVTEVRHAYGGAWQYFLFIGRAGGDEGREPTALSLTRPSGTLSRGTGEGRDEGRFVGSTLHP